MESKRSWFGWLTGSTKTAVKGIGGFWALEETLKFTTGLIGHLVEWANLKAHAETILWLLVIAIFLMIASKALKFTGAKLGSRLLLAAAAVGLVYVVQSLEKNVIQKVYAFFRDRITYIVRLNATDAVASVFFWFFFASVGFVVFFGTFSSILGIKKETKGVAQIIYWSLPLSFLLLFGYTTIRIHQKSQDPLYDVLTTHDIRTNTELQLLKHHRHIRHADMLRANKSYVINTVRSMYSKFIYDDIVNELGKKAIYTTNQDGQDAVLTAVKEGNLEALQSFQKHIDYTKKYNYGGFFNQRLMTPLSIAKEEGRYDVAEWLRERMGEKGIEIDEEKGFFDRLKDAFRRT